MTISDREAADIQTAQAADEAHRTVRRHEAASRGSPLLGLRQGLQEAVHTLREVAIASYAEIDGAGEAPLRDELVKVITDRIDAFVRSSTAGGRGGNAAAASSLGSATAASATAGLGRAFDLAVHTRMKRLAGAAPLSAPLETVAASDERFEILGLLGGGNYGEVHKAFDRKMNRTVALKYIAQTVRDGTALAHARAMSQLNHPNIAMVYEVLEGQRQPEVHALCDVVLMEFLDGQSLEERLATGPLSPDEVGTLCRSLVSAVEYTQRKRFVHGDLHEGTSFLASLEQRSSTSCLASQARARLRAPNVACCTTCTAVAQFWNACCAPPRWMPTASSAIRARWSC